MGRALRAAQVVNRPTPGAAVVRRLWPDGVLALRERRGDWYVVESGFVRTVDVQPMLLYDPGQALPSSEFPAWVSVIAPVAPLRRWAAGGAPLVDRVGWGGVLCAVDRIDDGRDIWYAVSACADGELLGWTPANRWTVVLDESPADGCQRSLALEADSSRVIAYQGGREVLRAPVTVPADYRPGTWPVLSRQPTGIVPGIQGAAWTITGAGGLVYGVHWHNDMGRGTRLAAGGWELSPLVARWLYRWLPADATIEVR